MFNLFEDYVFAFAPDSPLLGPGGGNIDTVNTKGEHASHRMAAMGDGVGLKEPGARFIPLIGVNGDMFFEK